MNSQFFKELRDIFQEQENMSLTFKSYQERKWGRYPVFWSNFCQ